VRRALCSILVNTDAHGHANRYRFSDSHGDGNADCLELRDGDEDSLIPMEWLLSRGLLAEVQFTETSTHRIVGHVHVSVPEVCPGEVKLVLSGTERYVESGTASQRCDFFGAEMMLRRVVPPTTTPFPSLMDGSAMATGQHVFTFR
jgi:hypothetical protein